MQREKNDGVSSKGKKLVCYLSEQSPQYMLTGKLFINVSTCIIQYPPRWIKGKEEKRKKREETKGIEFISPF